MSTKQKIPQMIKRQDAARLLGVSTITVKRWEQRGLLQGTKLNKNTVIYRLEQVSGLLSSGTDAVAA